MTITAPAPISPVNPTTVGTLYRLGVLTDALRDSAAVLLRAGREHDGPGTALQLTEQYTRLRHAISLELPDGTDDDLELWTADLEADASLAEVFAAAATLAAYVDQALAHDAFVAGWRQRDSQIRDFNASAGLVPAPDMPEKATGGGPGTPGPYL